MVKMNAPLIKVCGVRDLESLESVARSAADCVGINLVPTSPRSVCIETATSLFTRAAELNLKSVAVVMNPDPALLAELKRECQFDFLQLHGQESPELLDDDAPLNVIKAVSWSGRDEEAALAKSWLDSSRHSAWHLAAFLVDAYAPVEGGGTGRKADWNLLTPKPECFGNTSMILAGGLNPSNVSEAIERTKADGVDTASGVESSPGVKNEELVRQFAASAASALTL